ncbi:hypothetical protein PISMIDRAFT_397514 [Pisolithus microcarpus 441]|uniref:Unplaced genomic scaffold scaffold_30, whole genome shotgun sequence n=1 Tax=Pisolithus microcarpus 441 TaxID=765257 RepID=A0A0C9YHY4_9AGAM|nr:hypothetical protein PISMIDRAFT_397514 [Pisolithus microcarpus 441]
MWTRARNKTDDRYTGVMHTKSGAGPRVSCNVLRAPNFAHRHHFLVSTRNPKAKLKPATEHQTSISQWLERSQRNVVFSDSRRHPTRRLALPRCVAIFPPGCSHQTVNQSSGRSETRVGNLASIPETLGRASPGRLARMRRFFHRSNQGSSTAIATEVTDTEAGGVPQVAPDQDDRLPLQEAPGTERKSNKSNSRQLRPSMPKSQSLNQNQNRSQGKNQSQSRNRNQRRDPRQNRPASMSMLQYKNSSALIPCQVLPRAL